MLTAIVTGGSGGIGSAICRALCEEGYHVIVCYNSGRESAEKLVTDLTSAGHSAEAVRCDVRNESDIISAVGDAASSGTLAVAVNCAGTALFSQVQDTSAAELSDIFSVNSTGTFLMCREASKKMIPNHFGRIINISSMWGISGASCESAYSASKASVIGLTKALAKELGPSGITVNCVAPGLIDTPMNSRLSESDIASLVDDTPVGRIGTPEDIASAVLFFCNAPFVTGQTLCVDGGMTL